MKALYLIAPVFAMVANPVSAQVSRAERSAEPAVFSMAGPCDCSTNSDTRQVTASLSQEEGEEILQRLAKVSPASITTHGQLAEVIGNEKLLMAAAGDAEIELDKDEPRRKIDWKKVLRIVVIVLDAILNP